MSEDSNQLILDKLDKLVSMVDQLKSNNNLKKTIKYQHKYVCDGVSWSGRGAWPLPYRKAVSTELGNPDFDSISKEDRKKVLEKYLAVQ